MEMVINGSFISVIFAALLSYLIGSFPTAYALGKLKGVDIFASGSGNMGATNIARIFGLRWGIGVWLWDSSKGIVAILLARLILPNEDNNWFPSVLAGVMAIIGHNWSVWVTLLTGVVRGGKGAATAFGTLIMVAPAPVMVIVPFIAGVITVLITRYVSLAVLVVFGTSLPWMYLFSASHREIIPVWPQFYALLVTILIIYRFRENIQRLLTGTERRLGERNI